MGSGEFSPFLPFFSVFLRFLFVLFVFFFSLLSYSPRGKGQTTAIYCKNGEFHSDPVCTHPVQNFPTHLTHSLSFLSLFFGKRQGQPPKKQGFVIPTEPPKTLEKKGKTLKKTRKSLQGEKNKEFQKTRKGRTGLTID